MTTQSLKSAVDEVVPLTSEQAGSIGHSGFEPMPDEKANPIRAALDAIASGAHVVITADRLAALEAAERDAARYRGVRAGVTRKDERLFEAMLEIEPEWMEEDEFDKAVDIALNSQEGKANG